MRIRDAILFTGLMAIVISCVGSPESDSRAQSDQSATGNGARGMSQAARPSISSGDAGAIATFADLPGRWNRAAAPLMRDYVDPNVSAERWVQEASVHMSELRAVYLEMQACAIAIEDPGVRETFQEFATNYQAKLGALTALHNAVARGNQQAELDAQQALSEAAAEGQKLVGALMDRLRPYVDQQVLIDEFKKRGKEIGELMKPQ